MEQATYITRLPAVAGRFYPADRTDLGRSVRRYLDECVHVQAESPRALIVPHAGYVCSGIVAAAAFRTLTALPPAAYTIYLMGPAHTRPVRGIGFSSADFFQTPLGVVPVAQDRVRSMLQKGDMYHRREDAFGREHCLEVELPFLQTVLARTGTDFAIVPMLVDEAAAPVRLADDLVSLLAGDTHSLVVVSSDLSHYYDYVDAQTLDRGFLDAVVAGDAQAAQSGQACGLPAILALMEIAARLGWEPQLVDYLNSGDTCSRRNEVVGYGAVVYTA